MSLESPEENCMTGAKGINAELASNSLRVNGNHWIFLTFGASKQTRVGQRTYFKLSIIMHHESSSVA